MAGRDMMFARRVQPEPLSEPQRETTALNPEAEELVRSEEEPSEANEPAD